MFRMKAERAVFVGFSCFGLVENTVLSDTKVSSSCMSVLCGSAWTHHRDFIF